MGVRRRLIPRARPAAALFAALPLLCAPSAGCRPGRLDPARPDVVLVVVDTLRADHLGAYGYARDTTPRIDALARGGTRFTSAWAAAPWTLPSVMSIMTGRYPSSHRVENDGLKLSAGVPALAEMLRAAGYATAAFVSHVYVGRPFGFDRGFETFEDFGLSRPDYRLEAGMEPPADRVVGAAGAWLEAQRGRPAFLFVHLFDPHWPYDPPERFRPLFPTGYDGPLDAGYDSIARFQDPLVPIPEEYRRFLIDRYDAEIRFVDEQIGRLLDGVVSAGRAGRAWVILTADHGEEFKDHGSMGHGRRLYEEVLRVPLIVGRPEGGAETTGAGADIAAPVSGIDLFPTILALTGAGAAPGGVQGRSLANLIAGAGTDAGPVSGAAAPAPGRTIVGETIRLNAYLKAVRQGPLKLIRFLDENRGELYDLDSDPLERHDLSAGRPGERQRLMRALLAEVDLLSGGWNLRWSSDGAKRRFEGRIRTEGIFRSVVPLFQERGRFVIERGDTLRFSDSGQAGESGFSFTTAPAGAKVTFYLTIDGRALPGQVSLGAEGARPGVMPFTLEGDPSSGAAFVRPEHRPGLDVGYFLWRTRPAGPDQAIALDDEIRERLRSLGYVD